MVTITEDKNLSRRWKMVNEILESTRYSGFLEETVWKGMSMFASNGFPACRPVSTCSVCQSFPISTELQALKSTRLNYSEHEENYNLLQILPLLFLYKGEI